LLSICDRGPGLSEGELDRLLRPFERGEKSRGGPVGAGLGLAIVDRIAKRHGATLEFRHHEGGGLRVDVWFPLPPAPEPSSRA
jgi:two-component system osmolarity sensor histidine kinase EnvZ